MWVFLSGCFNGRGFQKGSECVCVVIQREKTMILSYPHTQKRKERVETRSSIAILAAGFEVWGQPLSRRSAGLSTKGGGKKKKRSDIIKVNRADHPSKDQPPNDNRASERASSILHSVPRPHLIHAPRFQSGFFFFSFFHLLYLASEL